MMLATGTFCRGFSDEELTRLKPVLKDEMAKLKAFEEVQVGEGWEGEVRMKMLAWVGIGWK